MSAIEIPIRVNLTVSESQQQFDLVVAENTQQYELGVSENVQQYDLTVEQNISVRPVASYDGEYVVTPKTVEQTLGTADKYMESDVLVRDIPYYETSNQSGITVYIADNLND